MIRRLRQKFVTVTMLSLLAVLILILGIAALFNYRNLIRDADETLHLLVQGEGGFGPDFDVQASRQENGHPFPGPGNDDRQSRTDMELPFRSRYFSVLLDRTGAALSSDLEHIASVGEEQALSLAQEAFASQKTSGTLSSYRFYKDTSASDTVRIIFLDINGELINFRRSVLSSALVALVGLAVVCVLVSLISQRVVRPLAESYEKQKRFITNASHELKTPLAVIRADTEVLETELSEDNEFLSDIRRQTDKMARLTAELVSLSRLEEEETAIRREEVPFSQLTEDAAETYHTAAAAGGKTFEADIAAGLTLRGDLKSLAQLLDILLDNALKYTPESGRIRLSLTEEGHQLCLTLDNTSSYPVSEEKCRHLFERFYRADEVRGQMTEGFGLGLSIADTIVKAHRGRIKAEAADDGKIFRMTVRLPKA